MDALAVPRARMLRDGSSAEIAVEAAVQDDLLILKAGDQVVAGGVVRTTTGPEIDESLLTGAALLESWPGRWFIGVAYDDRSATTNTSWRSSS